MKKVFSLCLCLILALSAVCVAYAEDFTIHAGVMFGDTREEVKEKENLMMVAEELSSYETAKKILGREYELETGEDLAAIIYWGTVAGIDNASINYYFNGDEKNNLFEALYHLANANNDGYDVVNKIYSNMKEALTEKYGEPLDYKDERYYLVLSHEIKVEQWYIDNSDNPENYKYEYDAWVVSSENYNVKIELLLKHNGDICRIVYHPFTDEELEIEKEEYNERKSKAMGDL